MRLPLLRLSKKANAFSAKGVSLRSAPRSPAYGGRFDARSAQSVFPTYTPPEKRFHFLPPPAGGVPARGRLHPYGSSAAYGCAQTLRGYFTDTAAG